MDRLFYQANQDYEMKEAVHDEIDDRNIEILLKAAFQQVKCEDEIKTRALNKIINDETPKRKRIFANASPHFSPLMRTIAVAVCVVITFVSGVCFYATPAAAICLDGELSLRLIVNRFDRILDVQAYNVVTEDSIKNVKAKGVKSEEFLRAIMQNKENIQENSEVYIISDNKAISDAILSKFTDDSKKEADSVDQVADITYHTVTENINSEAEKHGMTYQRYELYQKMQNLGISISMDQVKNMTLADMHDMIDEKINGNKIEGETGTGVIGNDNETAPIIGDSETEVLEPEVPEEEIVDTDIDDNTNIDVDIDENMQDKDILEDNIEESSDKVEDLNII